MTMQRESGASAVNTVLVFLSGVAIGMLCAKQTGSQTRGQIADMISKGRKRGEELLGRVGVGAGAADTTDRGHEQVERATEAGEEPNYESGKYT